jgi:protoporphyrinogen oxidase
VIAVVGGGPAGLAAAYRLTRAPLPGASAHPAVLLLERAPVLGGLAAGFRHGPYILDFGPHRLHAGAAAEVLADVRRLLGAELRLRPRRGRVRLDGRYLPFPVGPATAVRLGPRRLLPFAAGALAARLRRPAGDVAPSYESVLRARLGDPLYRAFYEPYAEKVWGLPGRRLAADQAERRVNQRGLADLARMLLGRGPGRRYLYPLGGFGRIPQAYAAALGATAGVDVRCGAAVEAVPWRPSETAAPAVTHVRYATPGGAARTVPVSDLIWTAPLPELIRRLDPPPPPSVRRAAAGLRFRAVVLCYVALKAPAVGRADTYYFPERRFPFNRVTEQKRFSATLAPPDRTVLCLDLACDPDDPVFAATDDELRARVLPALREAGLLDGAPVEAVFSRRFRHAYPVYDLDAAAALREVTDWISRFANLWTVGRQGLFLHNNTDHSLLMGYRAADAIAAGGGRRAWAAAVEGFATFRVAD